MKSEVLAFNNYIPWQSPKGQTHARSKQKSQNEDGTTQNHKDNACLMPFHLLSPHERDTKYGCGRVPAAYGLWSVQFCVFRAV